MAQRYSEFMTQPQIPGTGPTIQDFFSDRLFGDIRSGQPELGIYNTPQMQYPADNDNESQNAGQFQPEEQGVFSLRDLVGDIASKGVAGFKDVAGRSIASQALGGAGGMIFGPMGALAGGIAGLIKGGDLFNAPYIGAGAATMDEYGNMYTAEQLDKLNAAGGYYSDPARSSRRRDSRIRNMLERRDAGLQVGLKNLARLQEQQRQEEAARQSAASAMQQSNQESGTGGYQSDFAQDSDFMGGSGTAAEMGSF